MIIDESLSVSASPDQLGVVRAHVRTVAADHAFAADDLADLVLAVDEAAGILLDHSVPCSALTCVVAVEDPGVRVNLGAVTTDPINPDMTFFGWFVLRTLVDSVTVAVKHVRALGEKESWAVTITLKKAPHTQR
ncbi:ATP-binding protein [Rhodococcus sp. IEGM 1366]|uniref:ATP-binding protein n=1 Tax=Rhodococcus sp. IEGM 1366 TaxID=3082223 RepID=UPI002953C777|nr:ATP-binding protein [Rhodococcus sp. IEGM 1366]MDV8071313.1 ATP-binding protein [Rhodococcus sp. IEGM 1366]